MVSHSGLLTVMERAARKAGSKLRRDFGEVEHLQVSRKGPADFVSKADQAAERTIYEELSKARPGWGFLGEEGGELRRHAAEPRAGAHDDGVIILAHLLDGDVLAHLDIAQEADLFFFHNVVQGLHDALNTRVIRCHAVADQTERRWHLFKKIDLHIEVGFH